MSDNIDISIWDYVIMEHFMPNQKNERSSGVENTIDEMKASMESNYNNYMKPYNLLNKLLEVNTILEKDLDHYIENIANIILFIHTPIITQYLDIDINIYNLNKYLNKYIDYLGYLDTNVNYYTDGAALKFLNLFFGSNIIQRIPEIIYLYIDMIHEYTYIASTTDDKYTGEYIEAPNIIITRDAEQNININKLNDLLINYNRQHGIQYNDYFLKLMTRDTIPATEQERNLLNAEAEAHAEKVAEAEAHAEKVATKEFLTQMRKRGLDIATRTRATRRRGLGLGAINRVMQASDWELMWRHTATRASQQAPMRQRAKKSRKVRPSSNVPVGRFNGGKKNIYPKNKYSKKKYKYLRN